MALIAIAFPIPPGKKAEWRTFIDELRGSRHRDFTESRRKLGVRERTFLQETPMGDLVIVTLEGDNPMASFAEFGKQTDAFATWFKAQVKSIHGVDLGAPPPGPPPELVVDSGPA
ncbi:MAG TPA: hypothetical protein VNF73_15985 [Candidatus Saccharimonadales bacterium]|nr:hypothetical protein [Candidatus Saccharimonadales bacterium]